MRFAIDILAAMAALAPLCLATNDVINGGHGAIEFNKDLNKEGQDQSSAWTADKLIGGMGHGFMPSAKQEDNRILLATCTTTCAERPIVEVSGDDFRNLVSACIPGGSGCPTDFNEIPLNCWDTSKVTDMSLAFNDHAAFNSPLNCWDTSRVTSIQRIFDGATAFNQAINEWDMSSVTDTFDMFKLTSAFNQPIGDWDVSSVTKMQGMFYLASTFNQPIDEWDVSHVTTMAWMFHTASAFNQPIDEWDVSYVKRMDYMFIVAPSFNQCLGTWAMKTPSDVRTTNLFLNSGCSGSGTPDQTTGPWCQTTADSCYAKSAISRYEILASGDGTESAPYAIVESLEPFSGKVYFEAPSVSFIGLLGDDKVDLVFEMYGGAGDGDCDGGKKLTISDFSLYSNSDTNGYDTTTSDGVLGVASFSIEDFRSANLGATIFTQSTTSNEAGTIALCCRIVVKPKGSDAESEIVSYVDTHIRVDVDLTANFETFTQEVKISGTGAKVTNTDIVKVVDLESFLCGTSGVNDGKPSTSLYKIGQDFQVCVQPTEQYSADYSIVSFKNVTCSNTNLERKLITIDGVEDALTDTIDDVTGSKTADGALSFVAREGGKAFKSVVTAGYFDESAETPETSFSCTGEAVLTYSKSERSRFLVGTWTHSYDPTTNDPSRDLQETSTTELGPFATTIGLSNDGVDVFTAPAFLASHGWSSSLIVGVAGAAMIAIAVI